MSRKTRSILVSLSISVLVILGVFFYWRDIYDWWRLRSYTPSAEVERIVKKTDMTNDAKKYFYVAHPQITNQSTFNEKCRQGNLQEFSIILGCYISYDGIYVYRVDDKRLDGVIEVTSAHEMLHAAYERLGSSEKHEVNEMLASAYKKITDTRIKETIEQYRKNDPDSVLNELHSILATEVDNLPEGMEIYYKKYFNNRSVIVGISKDYEKEFSSRRGSAEQIQKQLEWLKNKIDEKQSNLQSQQASLQAEKRQMDQLLASGQTTQYNQMVEGFNNSVEQYNELVQEVRTMIDRYNQLVEQYQKLSTELNNLYESIDSRPSKL